MMKTKKQKKKNQITLDIEIKYQSSDDEENGEKHNNTKLTDEQNNVRDQVSYEEEEEEEDQHIKMRSTSGIKLKPYEKMLNSTVVDIFKAISSNSYCYKYSVYSTNVIGLDIESLNLTGTYYTDREYITRKLEDSGNTNFKFNKNIETEKLSYCLYTFVPNDYLKLTAFMFMFTAINSVTMNIICTCGNGMRKENVKLIGKIANEKRCESCGAFVSLEITKDNKPIKLHCDDNIYGIITKVEKCISNELKFTVKFNKYNGTEYVREYLKNLLIDNLA
jgi:hypothetical protein